MASRWFAWLVVYTLGGASIAIASQEMATDAERTYAQLRVAKDAKTRYLADRWQSLIRLQEWKSLDGKFTTTAKYVEHDPDLAWVKLRVITGTGANRVVKDVTIPLEKLNETCKSRVRQIARLSEKVETEAAEVAAEEQEDNAEQAGETPPGDEREDMLETEPVDEDPAKPRRERGRRRPPRDRQVDEQSQDEERPRPRRERVVRNTTPLPGRLPPLPTASASPEPPTTEVAADKSATGERAAIPPLDPDKPFMPDTDPWRTDYEKFRTVFQRDEDGIISTAERWWGVVELQSAIPQEYLGQEPSDTSPKPYVESPRAAEIGDFIWEGTVATQPSSVDPNWAEVFAFDALPEPLKLELRVTNPGRAKAWQILRPGDKVKFIGRFTGYKGAYTWVAEIMTVDAQVGISTAPSEAGAAAELTAE